MNRNLLSNCGDGANHQDVALHCTPITNTPASVPRDGAICVHFEYTSGSRCHFRDALSVEDSCGQINRSGRAIVQRHQRSHGLAHTIPSIKPGERGQDTLAYTMNHLPCSRCREWVCASYCSVSKCHKQKWGSKRKHTVLRKSVLGGELYDG